MNVTGDIFCYTCETSNGFGTTEGRGLIILVVLVIFVLVSCYVGVLWFGIRSRFIPDKTLNVVGDTSVHNNEAFNNDVEQDGENIQSTDTPRRTPITTTEHIHIEVNNETV